ncbi:MAG: YfhO family protein, partial [Bacteroidales bacterium]|nr:YfhO family protein [Bacteroidales bacterium]
PGKLKWGLFVVTLLSILLSWGKNFMWFSDIFINWFPMYNKFRTVSSILVIAEFTIPLLAILALKEWVQCPSLWKEKRKAFFISFALTGGIALLFALFPTLFFDFMSEGEKVSFLPQAAGNPQVTEILNDLETARMSIFTSDAWRSLLIIVIGAGALILYSLKKISASLLILGAIVLTVIDMGGVNKRYLNSSAFHVKSTIENPFPKSPADEVILADKDPNFRVYNQTVNSFNDPSTSYYHKSIGGYHAAKLRRYQDIIEHQLSKGNKAVFDMLNTKYIIDFDQTTKQPVAVLNPDALGNAWFVEHVEWVNSPDEEMAALNTINPKQTAVIDRRFENEFVAVKNIPAADSAAVIRLVEYKPNKLTYKSESQNAGVAVFSEIYYPYGWKATVDGKKVPIVRADYILRAIEVPAGDHEIVFTFYPHSIRVTEGIAYTGIAALFLMIILAGVAFVRKNKMITEK